MPLDAARWQLELQAADRTAAAFKSVEQRMKHAESQAKAAGSAMSSGLSGAGLAAGMSARIDSTIGSLGAMGGALRGMVPAITATSAAWAVWQAGMKAGELIDQADQLGVTTDQLQGYRLAAAQAGVGSNEFDGALRALTKAMGTANAGSADMIGTFDKLDVKLLNSQGELRKVSEITPEVARGLLAMKSETERNALMMQLFGDSGSKMVTILSDLARGNDAVVTSARAQGAVIDREVAQAWDRLGDRIKVANVQLDAWLATVGAPIAVSGLEHVLQVFESTRKEIEAIQKAWGWLTKTTTQAFEGGSSEDLAKRAETIKATLDVIKDSEDALDVAKVAGYRQELQRINDVLASRANVYVMPAATIEAPGVSQPKPKPTGGGGAGAVDRSALDQLRESQKQMDELVASIDKVRTASVGVLDQFGNGAETAARKTAELNEMLDMGFITQPVHAAAMRDLAMATEAQRIAFEGAQGGMTGFFAGLEAGLAGMEKSISAFELGQAMVNNLANSFTQMAMNGELSFQRIAQGFAQMLAQMAVQAAIHSALRMFLGAFGGGGMGGTGGGIADGLFSAIFGSPFGYAEGGRPAPGVPAIVGERGPELFIPDSAGTVIPNHALRGGGSGIGGMGGNTTVIVNQTVYVGEYVTTTQYRQGLRAVEQSAREGAEAALVRKGRHGDPRIGEAFR